MSFTARLVSAGRANTPAANRPRHAADAANSPSVTPAGTGLLSRLSPLFSRVDPGKRGRRKKRRFVRCFSRDREAAECRGERLCERFCINAGGGERRETGDSGTSPSQILARQSLRGTCPLLPVYPAFTRVALGARNARRISHSRATRIPHLRHIV